MIKLDKDEFFQKIADGADKWNEWLEQNKLDLYDGIRVEIVGYEFEELDLNGFDLSKVHFDIKNSTFKKNINLFMGATKVGSVWFSNCDHLPNIDFQNVEVTSLMIRDCIDVASLTLENCTISGLVDIYNVVFEGDLTISKCKCNEDRSRAPFFQMEKVVVAGNVVLDGSSFRSRFYFYDSEFKEEFLSRKVVFTCQAIFTRCKFYGFTDFSNTTFLKPPLFDGAILHEHTIFPKKSYFEIKGLGGNDNVQKNITALQILKAKSSSLLDRRQQAVFFGLEQEYLRYYGELNVFEYSISTIYGFVSDYGTNYFKPVVILLLLFCIFTGIYFFQQIPDISPMLDVYMNAFEKSLRISLMSITAPFKIISNPAYGMLQMLLSTLQSVLSLSLITLSILALRWRYKRD